MKKVVNLPTAHGNDACPDGAQLIPLHPVQADNSAATRRRAGPPSHHLPPVRRRGQELPFTMLTPADPPSACSPPHRHSRAGSRGIRRSSKPAHRAVSLGFHVSLSFREKNSLINQ